MMKIKNIDIKYTASAVFGAIALVISLFAGIFSGNGLSVVLFRAFSNMIIFAVIGFICLMVFKIYVPEVYQIISSFGNIEIEANSVSAATKDNIQDKQDNTQENPAAGMEKNIEPADASNSEESLETNRDDTELENEFNTLDKETPEYSSVATASQEAVAGSKPVLKKEKIIKYEPKIAAQAIRTMLKRDE